MKVSLRLFLTELQQNHKIDNNINRYFVNIPGFFFSHSFPQLSKKPQGISKNDRLNRPTRQHFLPLTTPEADGRNIISGKKVIYIMIKRIYGQNLKYQCYMIILYGFSIVLLSLHNND